MGNVQSERSVGAGSQKEALNHTSDSRRTSLVQPEVTSSSPATRPAQGLGVWFPGSSAPPGLLVTPEPQASPSPLPLTLELPSPVTPPPEEAAAVSTAPPPAVGSLLPTPSKWRKPTSTRVARIRGLLEASHSGQGDPLSVRPLLPLLPRQLIEKDPAPGAPVPPPTPLEPRKPPPPPPSDRQPRSRGITPALATSATSPTDSQAKLSAEGKTARGVRKGSPPQAGEGEMARFSASESGLSLLCKVTFKSRAPLSPAAASGPLTAKASLRGGRGRGLLATSSAISCTQVLKQGPLAPGAPRPPGEVPRGALETEGGEGEGEGCSGGPLAPESHTRALPPPAYTTFPGSKPKFDWVSPPEGPERHFRFNGAGGGIGAPRRRPAALSGPWGSPPPPRGKKHPIPGPRRPAPALLAPPMPPATRALVSPPIPRLPAPQQMPMAAVRPPTPRPGPGPGESVVVPDPTAPLPPTLAADQDPAPALAAAPSPSPSPAPATTEPLPPAPAPTKTRTRKNKGSRSARGATREDRLPGVGPRQKTVTDSRVGGSGAAPARAANTSAVRHWPPFQVLNSCSCKCYCRHQPHHRRLPSNVSAWLDTTTNHLSEPPWVTTIKLAGSLVAGLEHYDLQATHSD
ncbi:Gametogenetin [Heterocephalus glaber]|uniref:Gametogenetin n=1 Tax=Heterocephalus glaber TaxID=10181 RepID=G5AMB6_HETGA|nr:Gametogenetin [Heterocephalus glaber]